MSSYSRRRKNLAHNHLKKVAKKGVHVFNSNNFNTELASKGSSRSGRSNRHKFSGYIKRNKNFYSLRKTNRGKINSNIQGMGASGKNASAFFGGNSGLSLVSKNNLRYSLRNGKFLNRLNLNHNKQSRYSVKIGKGFFGMKSLYNQSSYIDFFTNCKFDSLMSVQRLKIKFKLMQLFNSLNKKNKTLVEFYSGKWLELGKSYYFPFWLIIKLGLKQIAQIQLKNYILSNYLQPAFF